MTRHIEKILVFCGSRTGTDPQDSIEAEKLGTLIGQGGYSLIYGGGRFGMMGILADAATNSGAKVKGIIPRFFARSVSENPDSPDQIVENMHIRKQEMILQCDAAIALPGGIGTLDEIYETATDNDIMKYIKGLEDRPIRPIILVSVNGYYDPLKLMMEKALARGYAPKELQNMFAFVSDSESAMKKIETLNAQPKLRLARELGPVFQ